MIDHFKPFPDCSLSNWIRQRSRNIRGCHLQSSKPWKPSSQRKPAESFWAHVEVPTFDPLSLQVKNTPFISILNLEPFWELFLWLVLIASLSLNWASSWFGFVVISCPPLGKKLLDGTALKSTFSGSLDSSPLESFTLEHLDIASGLQGSCEIDWAYLRILGIDRCCGPK